MRIVVCCMFLVGCGGVSITPEVFVDSGAEVSVPFDAGFDMGVDAPNPGQEAAISDTGVDAGIDANEAIAACGANAPNGCDAPKVCTSFCGGVYFCELPGALSDSGCPAALGGNYSCTFVCGGGVFNGYACEMTGILNDAGCTGNQACIDGGCL